MRVVNSQEQFDSLSVYLSGVEKVCEADKVRIKEDIEQLYLLLVLLDFF